LFTAAVIKVDVINAVFIAFLYGNALYVNICTFRVVDRLMLTIRIAFIMSSYINVNLLYLIVAYSK